MNLITAVAIRQSLYTNTKEYTYDPTCCPQRIINIRSVIIELDKQIEKELKNEESNT
jgi:hypothetical protein